MTMPEERGDHVVTALDALVEAVEQNVGDERQLVRKVSGLREARTTGTPVTHALGEERPPGTMELLGRVLSRLMEASGSTRRALARAMRTEGTSIPAIARLFGVTHQRISNILNHPAAAPSVLHEAPAPAPGEAGQFDQMPERVEAEGG
jgi:hypothetical protein